MQSLANLLTWLLSNKEKLVYATFNMDDYFKVTGKLRGAKVKYRTAVYGESQTDGTYNDLNREYKIYVKKDDEHLALEAIHRK